MGNGDENVLYAGAMLCEGKYPTWWIPVCPECGDTHSHSVGSHQIDPREWLKTHKLRCSRPDGTIFFFIKEIPEGKRAIDPQDVNEAGELLHRFDPCMYCGIPAGNVGIGACPGQTG